MQRNDLNRTSLLGSIIALALFTVSLCIFAPAIVYAQDVTVAPKRVVLEERDRGAQVALVNNSASEKTYRILIVEKKMTADGKLIDVEGPIENSAQELISYSPRRITLPPGGTQTVRLMVRKPANLAPGEYRSHLLFRAEAEADQGLTLDDVNAEDSDGVSSKLIPLYSLSIPVIVRHGDGDGQATISSAAITDEAGSPQLDVDLSRSGEHSIHGDLQVVHVSQGERYVVGSLLGVGVYSDSTSVRYQVPLFPPAGVKITPGELEIAYTARPDEGGATLATYKLPR
jgi:fimbrial chaperone protein